MNKDPYSRIASWYDMLIDPMSISIGEVGREMFPPAYGMFGLEVGCGTGTHLKYYQKAGCRIFGIDLSPAMLVVAREKLGKGVPLIRGDASKMPYSDGIFDLAVIVFALHEMPASVRMTVLGETKRVLKKEGRILIVDYHPGPVRFPDGWLVKMVMTFI